MDFVSSLAGVVVLATTIIFGSQPADTTDAGVRDAVELYFRGIATNNADDLKHCFAPCAHVKYVHKTSDGSDEVVAIPIASAIASWTSGPPSGSSGRIVSVETTGDRLAVAKADVVWRGRRYLDILTLYRVNEEWQIVDKVFVDEGAAR